MKDNQKKYTRKNYKGGVSDQNTVKVSLAALKKRLDNIELQIGTVRTKLEKPESAEPKQVQVTELLQPKTNPLENSQNIPPMRRNKIYGSNNSRGATLGMSNSYKVPEDNFKGVNPVGVRQTIPIEINEDQFNRVKDALKGMQKSLSEKNKTRYDFQKNILKALEVKLTDRSNYLKTKTQLNSEEQTELGKINSFLNLMNQAINSNYETMGGRKSRRYIKSKRSTRRKRTRKYKK